MEKKYMRRLNLTFSQLWWEAMRCCEECEISLTTLLTWKLNCFNALKLFTCSVHFAIFSSRAPLNIYTDFVLCQCKVNKTARQIAQLSLTRPGHILFTAHFWCFDRLDSDLLTSSGEAECLREGPLTIQLLWKNFFFWMLVLSVTWDW